MRRHICHAPNSPGASRSVRRVRGQPMSLAAESIILRVPQGVALVGLTAAVLVF